MALAIVKNPFSNFSNKRNTIFDLMKALAILSVILDHSLQRWIAGAQNSQLYSFIFLFQMPAFIFVSGYFSLHQIKKLDILSIKDQLFFLLKKTLSLIIPFFSFVLIKSLITGVYSDIYLCFVFPQKSLWFLYVLMWLEFLMILSNIVSLKIARRFSTRVFLCLIFFILLLTPFIITLFINPSVFDSKLICYYSLFFIFGLLFNLISTNVKFFKTTFFNIALLILSLIVCAIIIIIRPSIITDEETIINILIRLIGSVFAILLSYEVCYFMSKIAFFEFASKFGRLSLEFYYVHLLLFLIPIFTDLVDNAFVFICLYFMVVIVTFVVVIFLKCFYLTDFFCFGKK